MTALRKTCIIRCSSGQSGTMSILKLIAVCCILLSFTAAVTGKHLLCGRLPKRYDVSTKICCDGQLEARRTTDGLEQGCCHTSGGTGTRLYPVKTHICCGDQILPRQGSRGRTRACCPRGHTQRNGHDYYPEEQMCCGANIINMIEGIRCCGGTTYNHTSHLCCDTLDSVQIQMVPRINMRQSCCGGKVYDRSDKECVGIPNMSTATLHPFLDTCNGEPYHKRKKQCNNGTLHDFGWFPCNGQYIDLTTTRCCPADPYHNSTEFHTPDTNICCGNVSIPRQGRQTCCDNVVYDKKAGHGCCARMLADETRTVCCHSEVVDTHTADCCGDHKYEKHEELSCCATSWINTTESICCNLTSTFKTPINKKKQTDTQCCFHGDAGPLAYCDTDEMCTSTGVAKKNTTENSHISEMQTPAGVSNNMNVTRKPSDVAIPTHSTLVDKVYDSIPTHSTLVDKVYDSIPTHSTLVDKVYDSIPTHSTLVDKVYDSIPTHSTLVDKVYDSIPTHSTLVDKVYDSIPTHSTLVDKVYDSIPTHSTLVDKVYDSIPTHSTLVDKVYDSIPTHSTLVDKVYGSIPTHSTLVDKRPRCPLCGKSRSEKFSRHIRGKKYMYYLTINSIDIYMCRDAQGMKIKTTLQTSGDKRQSTRIVLRTDYICSCFKKGKKYILFRNRKLTKKTVQRFDDRDLLVRNSKRVWGLIKETCTEYRNKRTKSIRHKTRRKTADLMNKSRFKKRLMRQLCP